ncbi:MAG: shikimate dehydrogenase family protein, partial [Acidimicrobiia bacterium]
VTVAARRPVAAATAAALAPGAKGMALGDAAGSGDAFDVVVNATPLGMGGEAPPLDTSRLGPAQAVVDLVYHPARTPLLAAAAERGARTHNGLSMLVHQAALSFALWTGVEAPLAAMQAAARSALEGRP